MPRSLRLTALTLALLVLPALASARTWVIPHVLERSGTISNTQYTFDTDMFMTYTPGLAGTPAGDGATADFYLYDNTGQLMRAAGGAIVCNPCTYNLGAGGGGTPASRKVKLAMDELIMNAGGFDTSVKLGFGVLVVGGQDPDGVSVQGFVTNAHTSAFDLSVFGFNPEEIKSTLAPGPQLLGTSSRTWIIPHVLEKSGKISNTQYTFDTQMFAVYSGGLPGQPPTSSATMNLYLFDNTGVPWSGPIGDVCNPCTYALDGANRKRSITLDDLIVGNGGGFGGSPTKEGFAIAVVEGDVDQVSLQGFVVNSHTNAFDLSVFGFSPVEIQAAANVAVPDPDRLGAARSLRGTPNPARGEIAFAFELATAADVTLDVYDAAGRRVATLLSGRREAGNAVVKWDRRDGAGMRVPAGVYYGRLTAGDGSRMSKLVFLPE